MTKEQRDLFFEGLVTYKVFKSGISQRIKPYIFESVDPKLLEKYLSDGWEIDKKFRTKVRIRKEKTYDVAFEDEVWALFAKLGFLKLNKERNIKVPFEDDFSATQTFDIFAADGETILLITCKSSAEIKRANLKDAIETLGTRKEGILKSIRSLFSGTKHKVKFILATKNLILSDPDTERLNNYGILHFDEENLQYYYDLNKHLGVSARFQLLGNLFEGQIIPELQNKIPAIQGRMGGHTYYSFLIEPEKLLKIGYVLHRNRANKKLMPTYQRLIKRARLNSVQQFVEEGGYFPNSIIIDINTNGKRIGFDQASPQVDNSNSRIGILHLPKCYRSAFIIDGQHRLYGYANSQYKNTNTVPVVAFIDLARKEQVKLFMQINENQKSVPKNLRNTLNSDLLWNSDFYTDQIKALKLQIAQDLGEDKASPLYDRIIIGENPKSPLRCITIDTIKNGLDRSNFFGSFSKNTVKQEGTFYRGNNDLTYDTLFPFLNACFDIVKNSMPDEWANGDRESGFVFINPGIESLIRVFSDIIDHLVNESKVNPKTDKVEKIMKEVEVLLDPMMKYLNNLTIEKRVEFRKSYGAGLRVKYWRNLQKAIHDVLPNFLPDGMQKYWKDEAKAYNEESFKIIRDLETYLKNDFKNRLLTHYGTAWFKQGVPKPVYDEAISRAASKNYEAEENAPEVDAWDCLNIIDYRKIALHGRNWIEIFEKHYTLPGEEKLSKPKDSKTAWMQKLERIRNQNFHSYSVKVDEYEFLVLLEDWLLNEEN